MNRIYKVIYSKARQCYIVVSELAKSNHKSSQQGADHTNTPALARIIAVALAAGALTWGSVPEVSWAADNTTVKDSNGNEVTTTDSNNKDINANITGKNNKVTDSSNAEIVGDNNTVTNKAVGEDGSVRYVRSNDARIHGSGNTISASRNQQVIGDNNTIMGRDDGTVTDYQHPEGREPNVSDLTIGRGNFIRSTDTYRNEWDSLKVIGNNNRADFKIESAGGPAAGIVIGDNQNIDGIQDSIVIGSLSPSEQQLSPSGKPKEKNEIGDLYSVGANSIIIGYHTKIKRYGEGIVVGNRSQGIGIYETIMGSRSIIGSDTSDLDSGSGALASIYGAFNKIEDADSPAESAADVDGVGNSINGSLNITSSARGTMIMGVGNTVTHSKGPDILGKDEDTPGATGYWVSSGLYGASYYAQGADTVAEGNNLNISYDEMRNSWQKYMETSGGAVSVLGNSNNADYAIRSQILGTGNTITGSEKNMSAYNTVSGFANTGTNIKRSSIVGTGNNLKNGEDNVVIGDYHNLENGKHNVILGSMDYTEKQVTKQSKSAWAMTNEHPDGTFEYTVTEQVPVKNHTKDIENAVMVGYNTDATVDSGVALGSESIASTEAGKTGYDAKGKTHAKPDKDYAAWVSTDAAVSVGRAEEKDEKTGKVISNAITRQITNLAAGTQDTDAVNVAQLKASEANINTTINNVDKKVAVIFDDKGSLMSTDATIYHNHEDGFGITNVSKGIALGHNAYIFNQGGGKADAMLFGSPTYTSGIAIGENAYVLEDSIDLGNKIYKGAMGDVSDLSKYDAKTSSGTGRLLIGNNSYSSGTLSTLIGNHSIMTTNYLNGRRWNAMQNAGAVSIGALNSIESYSSDSNMSGVANSIIGLANKTTNANGALILGAGNEIKNSITSISVSGSASTDVATASQAIRDSMANGYAGGATLIIGGGNKTDYTQSSQIIGVGSSITGTKENPAQFNMLNGVQSHINNSSSVYAIGYQNTIGNSNKSIVVGDYHKLDGGNNNVIIGSMDSVKKTETIVHHGWLGDWTEEVTTETPIEHTKNLEDAVMIGHNANAKVNKGVALGAGSVASVDNASVDKNAIGYDPATKKPSTVDSSTWKSTAAAVSVGDASQNITRQITNVAAGAQDTDAVNVAQLKAVSSAINTDITASKTHFYSVNSTDEKAKNYDNKGATAANALAAGVGANADKASAVAIGDTAYAGSANGVAIGTGSWIRSSNGNKPNANGGDVAIGQDSHVDSYVNQGGSIALGQNARVENTNGSTERKYAFGQTEFEGDNIPLNPGNEAGGVAIGRNSFARTGSLMVGSHMYKGAIADMDEVNGTDSQKLRDNFNNINMTTLGTNSFNNGTFATVTGSYSATTANPKKKIQNFAATIDGSLNSIESYKYQDKDAADNSGVASSIVGTANRIANSNNTTILGAGNEVTNSLTDFKAPTEGGASAKALQDTLKATLQKDAKGAVVISGIGNKVDSSHGVSVLGSKNVVNATDNIQLLGDNREVTGATGSVIIGSADSTTTTSVKDATILGHNATVEKEGGVALGAGSAASIDKDQHGYDFLTKAASASDKKEWKSSWAAVSVGDAEHTRQITNLAAGFNDTDAVNVAQLKNVMNMPVHIYSGGTINTTGTQITNDMTISNLQLDFGDGLKAQEVGNDGDKRVLVTLDKDALKNDPAFKGGELSS